MSKHTITNAYKQLRGFSTDSIYQLPSYVADKAVNIQRLPENSFGPRRGYQVQSSNIGGLGSSVYENHVDQETEAVCVSSDGNLYKQRKGTLTIEFNGTDRHEYLSYMIYVDPTKTTDTQTCHFDPLAIINQFALVNDSINFLLQKLTVYVDAVIGTGSASYSGVLAGAPLTPASIEMTDGVLTIQDNGDGGFTGDIGVGTNTIDYTTGAYSVNFSGVTGAVTADYRSALNVVFDQPMGKGFDVSSPYLISSLITLLSGISGVTVTSTGQTNFPGAFIEICEATNIPNGKTSTLEWSFWEICNKTVPVTFIGLRNHLALPDFQNATFAAYQEVIYIADPWDFVQKFDGQNVYRAGMPMGSIAYAIPEGTTGNVDVGKHSYYITYEQIDATGRLVVGALSTSIINTIIDFDIDFVNLNSIETTVNGVALAPPVTFSVNQATTIALVATQIATDPAVFSATVTGTRQITVVFVLGALSTVNSVVTTLGATQPTATITETTKLNVTSPDIVDVTYENLIQGSGWNTDCAIIDGGPHNSVNTIPVLIPHSMRVGDTAYFIDSITKERLTRNITSITASSITIDGDPVTVDDSNDWESAISNNLIVSVWRTVVGGTIPKLVAQIPNNSYSATTTYEDNTSDANLVLEYKTPVKRPDPPPIVGVVFPYRNQLIFTQDPNNDDYVWFSDPDNPEYVSTEILKGNNFIVPSNDDNCTGCGIAGSTLVVFKNRSIYSVSGDLATSQFEVVPIAPGSNIGSVNHSSIASVAGLLYFLNTNGVFAISENSIFPTDKFGNPIPLTLPIDQIFRSQQLQSDRRYVLRRATAISYTQDNQYLLYLPCEEETGVRYGNDNSKVLCYDHQGKNWFIWTNINADGGFYEIDNNLCWQDRRPSVDTIKSNTYKQHRKYRLIDQVDHVTPIRTTFTSSWEDLGQPRVRKKFVRAILLFDSISALFQINRPLLCFSTFVDWQPDIDSTLADLTAQIESRNWNLQPWDWSEWSGYQDAFVTVPLKMGTVAKSMSMQIQLNQLNTSFSLQGFQFEVAPDFRKTVTR